MARLMFATVIAILAVWNAQSVNGVVMLQTDHQKAAEAQTGFYTGAHTDYSYDTHRWLTAQTTTYAGGTLGYELEYAPLLNGNISRRTWGGGSYDYVYDGMNRLTRQLSYGACSLVGRPGLWESQDARLDEFVRMSPYCNGASNPTRFMGGGAGAKIGENGKGGEQSGDTLTMILFSIPTREVIILTPDSLIYASGGPCSFGPNLSELNECLYQFWHPVVEKKLSEKERRRVNRIIRQSKIIPEKYGTYVGKPEVEDGVEYAVYLNDKCLIDYVPSSNSQVKPIKVIRLYKEIIGMVPSEYVKDNPYLMRWLE